MHYLEFEKKDLRKLYRIGAVSSLLQLAVICIYMLVVATLGPRITSAEEFFLAMETSFWSSLFRVDLILLILVGLYLGNFPALLVSLWRVNHVTTLFAFMFTIIAVALSLAGESTFALFYLGKQYLASSSEVERSQFMAAGEAIYANGWWNSTGSYMTGVLLQGGGVMISLVMLRSHNFSKITALAGLIGNSFDLLQHLLTPFVPEVAQYLSFAMVAYLIWYPMLARDLFRLGQVKQMEA